GRRLKRNTALDHLLSRYLRAAVYATPAGLARLFAVPRADVDAALTRLARTDAVSTGMEIEGRAGRFLVSQGRRGGRSPPFLPRAGARSSCSPPCSVRLRAGWSAACCGARWSASPSRTWTLP